MPLRTLQQVRSTFHRPALGLLSLPGQAVTVPNLSNDLYVQSGYVLSRATLAQKQQELETRINDVWLAQQEAWVQQQMNDPTNNRRNWQEFQSQYQPIGWEWSTFGYHVIGPRLRSQFAADNPWDPFYDTTKKNEWDEIMEPLPTPN
jgi:hypothetical protein